MKPVKYFICIMSSFVLADKGAAEVITGSVVQGKSRIEYTVDSNTQRYSVNLENAFNPKILINKEDLERVSCEKESLIVKDLAGTLNANAFQLGRSNVKLTFSLTDIDLANLENLISQDLTQKKYLLPNLKSETKFFISHLDTKFSWMNTSLTLNAKAKLTTVVEDLIEQALKNASGMSQLHETGRISVEVPYHVTICDLIKNNAAIGLYSTIDVYSDKQAKSVLTKSQISAVNNNIVSMDKQIKKAQESKKAFYDADTRRVIHASAALAFSLGKIGISSGYLASDNFESILSNMFSFYLTEPKKMTEKDVDDLYKHLSVEARTEEANIRLVKEELKVEVKK